MIELPDMETLPFSAAAWAQACDAAAAQRVEDSVMLDVQRGLSRIGRWDGVYMLSVLARYETSVLIDAEGRVFLDWGTAGQVTLQPPIGAKAPFQLWVHTHPGFAAYWSSTDTHSLAIGAGIVEQAMVLGEPGPKSSSNLQFLEGKAEHRLSDHGPLAQWSEEPGVTWGDWYEVKGLRTEADA